MRLWLVLLFVLFPVVLWADPNKKSKNLEFVEVVSQQRHSISPNVVFVIDASSTINNSDDIKRKLNRAWWSIVNKLGSDEWYFSIYVFHDKNRERFRGWADASGPMGVSELNKAFKWIKKNTGIHSFGCKALGLALRQKNPLIRNRVMARSLTVVLITDGGFTEAAKARNFNPVYKMIKRSQHWRVRAGLLRASICAVGLENKEVWSLSTKRPDWECQQFLRNVGVKYHGGYYLVRQRKEKRKKR